MGVIEPVLGLRDRKKIKTRDAIRRAAMRLIHANGYAGTTIEQIAERRRVAEYRTSVSPARRWCSLPTTLTR